MTTFWRAPFNRGLSRFFPLLLMMTVVCGANVAQAAVAFATSGAVATGTTSLSVPHPAGIAAGDLLVLAVGNKYPLNGPSIPAGWTLVANGQQSGGLGAAGADSGQVYATVFVKQALGGESGTNLTVTIASANTSMARMFRYTKAAGTVWDYAATNGADNTAGYPWSVTGAANPGITSGDMVVVVSAINGNLVKRWGAQSVSATGATFTTHTEQQDSRSGIDDDMMLVVSDHTVTAGTASAAPVFTMTGDSAGGSVSANSPTGAFVLLRIREATTTTLATGSDPAAATVAPGAAVTDVNQFTLQTNSGTEIISSVTVNLSTLNGVGLLAITNSANTVLGSTASPVTGANTISVTGMSATTTLTTFKVRVTPLGHAAMPAPPGAAYAITAPVTAWVGGGTHAHTGTDTNPNALTIDNASPANLSAASCTAGDGQVTLNWTIPADTDFNSSVALRNSSAVVDTPVEGASYSVGNAIGTSPVRCVVAAPTATCTDTGLSNGTAYHYRLFTRDNNGNYSATGVVPSGSPCTPTSAAPSSFNAFETSTAALAINGKIFTKLAGIGPFGLDVVAISGGAQAAGFSNNVKVELLANSGTPGSGYGADNCPTANVVLQTIASTAISGGRATVSFAAVASASRDVRLRISYPTVTPTVTSCSTDSFAIRPQAFTVSSSNANADATGTSTSATPVVKAGSAFALTATAVAGYSTTPVLDASKAGAHAGAVATGAPAGSFGAANPASGAASGASFSYTEVGYFRLAPNGVYDDQFTAAVDASLADCTNDFSNTLVGGQYGCKFGNTTPTSYFGRFVPDRFALTPGSLIDRAGINTGASETCASFFSYMGEDFKTTFTLTAQNATPATTQNYTGGHARFVITSWSNFAFTASSGTLQQGTATPSGSWSSTAGSYGTAVVTAAHRITRPTTPTTPATSFSVSAQPSYTDGGQTVQLSASTQAHSGTTALRFGRLRLGNAYGSELLDLPMLVQTQFWNGSAFVTNTDDNCTTLASSSIALSNYQQNLASGETGVSPVTVNFTAGVGSMKLTRPGAGNSGSADLCVDLGPDPAGGTVCAASAANLPFLQGKWPPGTNWDNDPAARATFGIYKSPLIYRRENY